MKQHWGMGHTDIMDLPTRCLGAHRMRATFQPPVMQNPTQLTGNRQTQNKQQHLKERTVCFLNASTLLKCLRLKTTKDTQFYRSRTAGEAVKNTRRSAGM